jgi:hypothetical protein
VIDTSLGTVHVVLGGGGSLTRLNVTYYNVNKPFGDLSVFETFTLQRRRSD